MQAASKAERGPSYKDNEARILALLAVAYWRPVDAKVLDSLRRASKALSSRNPALAPILVAQAGLGRIDFDEHTAFRLFAAERLLDAGIAPLELIKGLGLDPRPLDALKTYDPDEPRIPAGQPGGGEWTSESEAGAVSALDARRQFAQEILPPDELAPDTIFSRPPVEIVRPPLEDYPTDPTKPPGPGFEWRGRPGSQPGDKTGNWYNRDTDETLRPNLDHPPPIPPHWDYRAPDGNWYRWFPDGTLEPKSGLIA